MPRAASAPPAVVVNGVSKAFRLPQEQMHTLKERALHPFRRQRYDELRALRDVSFAVQPGEFFGIVGRNGSGKSTLLKCLAGIYRTDAGEIYVNGRLSTFIELGVGFNPDLAALDNVTINAVMLGLNPREARERFERVIAFAELEEFTDLKLKNYSSGMQVRLAFSVMIEVDADILLIDEVLAVGDAAFQQKCFDVFHRMRDEGRTILFVTHDMGAVARFCDRALLLERGELRLVGEPHTVTNHYMELNFAREMPVEAEPEEPGEERFGDQKAQIVEAWAEDEHGERRTTLRQGRPCTFRARVVFNEALKDPAVGFVFENDRHHPLFATANEWIGQPTGSFAPGDEIVFSVTFDNAFAPGRVHVTPCVAHRGSGGRWIDRREQMVSALVTGAYDAGGLVNLPHDFVVERSPASAAPGTIRA